MKTCPSVQELERLLDEELNDTHQQALAEHVGACASCQIALERLTQPGDELQSVSRSLSRQQVEASTSPPDSQTAFLAHLKAFPPASISQIASAETTPDKSTWHEPPTVQGYEILGELGRGGMGVVYKARHVALDRVVALKMILAGHHAGEKDRERFRQEAAAIARLHHPHIVQVFDIGDAGGRPYFALEFVEQGSLAQYLRGQPQPLSTILPLIETLARAMAYAHQCGIIHRDLKPANILLSTPEERRGGKESLSSLVLDQKFVPKITDFGLAKRMDEEASRFSSGEVLGTPTYMAPEQADTKTREISPATDVYALGVIFYEMLTGRPPFKSVNALETLLQVLHTEPVRPGRLRPKLPPDVETMCLKCLEKDPARRYASAAALADDLRRYRRGDPIEARPVGLIERGWKFARRRPMSSALVAGIVLVTLLGFSGVTWQWRVAVRERNEQEYQRQQARTALYYSRIAQSQLQWRVNDVAGALRSLEDCIPKEGDLYDRRGWEWYYLQTLYRPELFTLRHSRAGVEGSVLFDPRGRTIVSLVSFAPEGDNERGEMRVWDAVSRKLLLQRTLASPFHRVAFFPDGKRLILGGSDGKVAVWDTTTYEEIWQDSLSSGRVTSVAVSADGKTVAAAGMALFDPAKRSEIKLWDAERGTSKQHLSPVEAGGFYCVTFHPRLPLLASGGEDNMVRIWSVTDGTEVRSLGGHKSAVNGVAFSPDGRLLVSAGNNGDLKIWNLQQDPQAPQPSQTSDDFPKGRIVSQSLTGRTGAILSLAFSPDSRYFAYSGTDKTVRVWDVESGTGALTYRGHTAVVEGTQFSPDGQRLVSCSPAQGEIKVWDLTRHPEFSTLVRTTGDRDHPARDVENIAFHEDGRHLVSVTVVGELQVWDALSGVLRAQHSLPISAEPFDVGGMLATFSPNGRRLAGRCREDRCLARIWDVDRGTELYTFRGHQLQIFCLHFSRDGHYLATCACDDKTNGKPFEIKVWNADTGKFLGDMSGAGRVLALTFSPDGRWLVVGNDDRLRVFDWAGRKEMFSLSTGGRHMGRITALAFRADGARLACAGVNDPTISIWDSSKWNHAPPANQHPLQSLAAPAQLCDLAFSPDGKRLVAASRDVIKMWDTETGVEVLTLRGAPQRYRDPPFNARVVFHADGFRLAGTNWNESISIWDAPRPADDEARLVQEEVRRHGADERALFWHLQEAEHCVEHKMMYAVQFHLQRLSAAPLPPLLQARVARVRARLAKETQ